MDDSKGGASHAVHISPEQVQRFCEFLYRRTGMSFTESKRYFIDRRLEDRIAATGSSSFQEYFSLLRTDADQEIEHLINSFTVNETYFYREDHQLRCMTASLLDAIVRQKKPGGTVRIWSIPCSTGEEPYSIALWLMENWPQVDSYNIEIVGSDIDTRALKAATEGVYGDRALMRLSRDIISRYFRPVAGGYYQIDEGLRNSIEFTPANLIDPQDMTQYRDFDLIFCRNVLIYFDDASRRLAAENLYDCLRPGGYICLGHSESMSRISPLFQCIPVSRRDRLSKAGGRSWLIRQRRPKRGFWWSMIRRWCGFITDLRLRRPASRSSRRSMASRRWRRCCRNRSIW